MKSSNWPTVDDVGPIMSANMRKDEEMRKKRNKAQERFVSTGEGMTVTLPGEKPPKKERGRPTKENTIAPKGESAKKKGKGSK